MVRSGAERQIAADDQIAVWHNADGVLRPSGRDLLTAVGRSVPPTAISHGWCFSKTPGFAPVRRDD